MNKRYPIGSMEEKFLQDAATAIRRRTMEGKLPQRDAKNPDADNGPFRLFPVSLPK
jgi:hypothetical protein